MAFDDLAQALNMFTSGVNQLQLSRAIQGANEQVQQIRQSEAKDSEKRAQLQQISNNMVARLAGMGTPATTIQQVAGAFTPPTYKDANEMYLAGVTQDNEELMQEAEQVKAFDPQNKLAIAQMRAMGGMQSSRLREQQEEFITRQQAAIAQQDPALRRGSAAGQVATALNRLQESSALFEKGDANVKLQQLAELPIIINTALGGGVGNQLTYEHLSPGNTLAKQAAKLKEMLTSDPQSANMPGFVEMYRDTIDRIKRTAAGQLQDQIKSIFKGRSRAVGMDPDAFNQSFKGMLEKYGIEDNLNYDPKTKKITFDSDLEQGNVKKALEQVVNKGDLKTYRVIEQARPSETTSILRKNPKLNAKLLQLINRE